MKPAESNMNSTRMEKAGEMSMCQLKEKRMCVKKRNWRGLGSVTDEMFRYFK